MTPNRWTESALSYHARTAHSPASVRASGHTLEWDIKPSPFKLYADLPPIPLPRDLPALPMDALQALVGAGPRPARLDLDALAGLLFFSAGITRRKVYPGGGEVYFRAAASTGALYQTEAYVVAGEIDGLPAGVYHFSPGDFALRRLREGDFRAAAALAAADDAVAAAPATVALTGLYWRNAWKYRARAYRHLFWDAGTILANLLAVAAALGLPARLVAGFVDREVNGLLGLDAEKEGALLLVPLGREGRPAPVAPPVTPLGHRVVPASPREVDEPLLQDAYANSCLDGEAEVLEWRESAEAPPAAPPSGGGNAAALPAPRTTAGRGLGETILARGSPREFSRAPLALDELSTVLFHATRGSLADVASGLVDLFVNVHAVDGLAPGAYRYLPGPHVLDRRRAGDVRAESAFLCLEQALGGAGSATVFFLADLPRLLARFGNRGYRLANLEAGLIGGRLYLGAYAQGFGATGLTFYDAEVVAALAPEAAGAAAIFVTALGRSPRQAPAPAVL